MESVSTSVTEAVAKALTELGVANGANVDMDTVRQKIAEKLFREYCPLRQCRKTLDMTIGQVAEDSGLSKVTVSHYEAGYPQAAAPSLTNLIALFGAVSPGSKALGGDSALEHWISASVGSYCAWYLAAMGSNESRYIAENTDGDGPYFPEDNG